MFVAQERVWVGDKLAVFSTQEVVSTVSVSSRRKTRGTGTVCSKW